jgi:hypothetical protein
VEVLGFVLQTFIRLQLKLGELVVVVQVQHLMVIMAVAVVAHTAHPWLL